MSIATKADLRKAIREAETTAVLLRQPGFVPMTKGNQRRIADLLADLAEMARRAFDPHARHDWSVVPADEPMEGPEDVPDLFTGDAA